VGGRVHALCGLAADSVGRRTSLAWARWELLEGVARLSIAWLPYAGEEGDVGGHPMLMRASYRA